MERPRVLIAEPDRFSVRARQILEAVATVELKATTGAELPGAFARYDAIWVRLASTIDATTIGVQPRCQLLATATTGLDHIDLDACAREGVAVISLKGETAFLREVRATAEHTVALLLSLLRQIPAASDSARSGEWQRDRFPGHELYERTVGIVGVGRLGTIVAGYLRAFGMHVIGTDPHVTAPDGVLDEQVDLPTLLRRADVVTIHVDYQAATRHLIGAEQLVLLAPHAVLVNTSRGGVIDEAALGAALREGRIAGAALDVLDGEPHITGEHPLVALARHDRRLLITPHIGGNTPESFERTECFIAGRIAAALEGNRP